MNAAMGFLPIDGYLALPLALPPPPFLAINAEFEHTEPIPIDHRRDTGGAPHASSAAAPLARRPAQKRQELNRQGQLDPSAPSFGQLAILAEPSPRASIPDITPALDSPSRRKRTPWLGPCGCTAAVRVVSKRPRGVGRLVMQIRMRCVLADDLAFIPTSQRRWSCAETFGSRDAGASARVERPSNPRPRSQGAKKRWQRDPWETWVLALARGS